jgi:cytidylate kinase
MQFPVICISHTTAAGGETIGQAVAEQLGFRYVDEEIISMAGRLAQVDPALVAATERKQPLMQRLLDKLGAAQQAIGAIALASGGLHLESSQRLGATQAPSEDLRAMIRAAISAVGKAGNAVIVAHAASMALAGTPGVLRVLVTAPEETRRDRLAQDQALTAAEATKILSKSDQGRRSYFQTFYKLEQELPTHYDLVLNTEVLTPEQVTALIVFAARN